MENTKKYYYISEEELSNHNKKGDIWISINGKIYDVSDWLKDHPGGDLALLYFGGQDVTDVFLAYHPQSSHMYLDQFFTGFHVEDYKVSAMSLDYRTLWSEFQRRGVFEDKGHGTMLLILVALAMFCVSIYGVLASDSLWVQLACGGLLGFSWIQFGWVVHDSAHYQTMLTPYWNRVVHVVFSNCLTGIAIGWWKKGHNVHHIATNSLEYDPTTQFLPFFAQTPKSFASLRSYFYDKNIKFDSCTRHLVSYQNYTFLLSIILARVIQFAESFNLLLSKNNTVPHRVQDLVGLAVFWTWFSLLVSTLPNCFVMVAFVVVTFLVAAIQSFQISINHICCDTYIAPPKSNDWVEKQTSGSLNFACSPYVDWFHGGLQFQIEHHLFPRMPRNQLRNISNEVQHLCKKHNLAYNCANSFLEASIMTLTTVTLVAFGARNYNLRSS
ncbi:hypothetical protein vseg_004341 [Gypsophila vaccaria]